MSIGVKTTISCLAPVVLEVVKIVLGRGKVNKRKKKRRNKRRKAIRIFG